MKTTTACLGWILLTGTLILGADRTWAQSGDAASALSDPVRQKIEKLLDEAGEDLANGRLGGPGRDNASAKYQEIEALDPGNKAAHEGLKRIAAKALELAEDALALDERLQASEFLNIAVQAGADPKKVARLRGETLPLKASAKVKDPTPASAGAQEPASASAGVKESPPTDQTEPRTGTDRPVITNNTEYERVLNGERHIRRALEALVDGKREEARWNLEQARRLVPHDPGLRRLEKRLAALDQDNIRQARQSLDQAEGLLNSGRIREAEELIDQAAGSLGWGGRVAQLKNRIRNAQPKQSSPPEPGAGMINTAGIKFNQIPAGRFFMGSAVETLTRPDELPRHEIAITKPFWMGVTEVTQAQWIEVMGENPSRFRDEKGLRPVEQVSLEEVAVFLRKLNEKDKGLFHRLPTEAEWEYACRAGSTTQYSFGDDPKQLIKYGWFVGSAGFRTHPVGLKKANAWGLHDFHGNVWEICSDWYQADYYSVSPEKDPPGPEQGEKKIIRGGCFLDGPVSLRSAYRATFRKSFRTGFRVVAEKR